MSDLFKPQRALRLHRQSGSESAMPDHKALKIPNWISRRTQRTILDYFDLLVRDHGLVRVIYPNRHRLSDVFLRAGQPSPQDIRRYAEGGIRTIVNLRGERNRGWYRLEREACDKFGLKLVNSPIKAGRAPVTERVAGFEALFKKIEYPALVHCKSGCDRSGFVSVLYLHFQLGVPLDKAIDQLGIRYGHIKTGKVGILDHLFYEYRAHNEISPIPFLEWLKMHYEPNALDSSFSTTTFGDIIKRYYLN